MERGIFCPIKRSTIIEKASILQTSMNMPNFQHVSTPRLGLLKCSLWRKRFQRSAFISLSGAKSKFIIDSEALSTHKVVLFQLYWYNLSDTSSIMCMQLQCIKVFIPIWFIPRE